MEVPSVVAEAVLVKPSKESIAEMAARPRVAGYDFNKGINYHELLQTYKTSGFQATNFGLAVDQINAMVRDLQIRSSTNRSLFS